MKALLILFFALGFTHGQAQVIDIFENTKADKQIDIKDNIVDVNSTLRVNLNKDTLLELLGRNGGAGNEALVERLERLNFVLKNQIETLKALEESVRSAGTGDPIEKLGKYSILMNDFYERLKGDPELRARVNELFDEHRAKRGTLDREVYPTVQAYILKNLVADQRDILGTLRDSDEVKRMEIQVIATLNTRGEYGRRVHVENFDQYALGEFYEVERWVTTFSQEDLQVFEQSRALATELNTLVDQNAGGLEDLIRNNLPSITCVENLIAKYDDTFSNRNAIFAADLETATDFLNFCKNTLGNIYEPMTALRNVDSGNLLAEFNKLQKQFLDAVDEGPNQIAERFSNLPEALKSIEAIKELRKQTTDCIAQVEKDAELVKTIYSFAASLLSPLQTSANDAVDIGGEVFSFALGELPEEGFIDLRTTGKRENGDELVVKVISKTKRDSADRRPGTVLTRRALKLQQIGVFLTPHVTVIMANPYNRSPEVMLKRNFQFAPSGSLLLKCGSRTSKVWNFMSPGLGVNMSTPDFDLDGTPDIAVGPVLSMVKDILSFGWAYNTKTDSPLWVFGLSLPFSNLGFPISSPPKSE